MSSKVAATVWVTSVNVDAAASHVESQVHNSVEDVVRGGADGEFCFTLFRWCQHASACVGIRLFRWCLSRYHPISFES